MNCALVATLGLLALPASLCAQRLAPVPPRAAYAFAGEASHARPPLAAPTSGAPDYRWEGMAIGAIAVGVIGAVGGSQLCHLSDSVNQHCTRDAVGLGILGAMVGGVVGGLIGGAIPKHVTGSSP